MNRSFYQRKADSLAGFIYADDTDSQIIANPADIARFLVMILCHLIDVEQAGKTVFQFYNNAEFKDFTTLAPTISSTSWSLTAVSHGFGRQSLWLKEILCFLCQKT